MFTIEIAGLLVEIDNRYEEIRKRCKDYIVKSYREPDIRVKTTNQMMEGPVRWYQENDPEHLSLEMIEFSAIRFEIYLQLPRFDAVWLHACSVAVDGEGYSFTVTSGYGKTTQAMLWLEYFGPCAYIVNGDNAILRYMDGGCYLCGSPWGGSEGYHCNCKVPMKAIYYLRHSDENHICQMEPETAFSNMIRINQAHGVISKSNQNQLFSVWSRIVEEIPIYWLYCTPSMEAVKAAYYRKSEITSQ